MDRALTGKDIKNYFNGKCKVMTYDELHKYKSMDSLLYPYNRVVILYVFSNNNGSPYGHWICVFRNINNNNEVFDSLGNFVDGFLDKINKQFRNESGQKFKYLSDLLIKDKHLTEYNDIALQGKKTKTCGKWCIYRMYRDDLTIEDFQNLFTKNNKINDDIILKLFNHKVVRLATPN